MPKRITAPPSTNGNGHNRLLEFTRNELEERHQILNALLGRSNFLKQVDGSERDIDTECGYPTTGELTVKGFYKPFYDRHAIATRVVQVYPEETWNTVPEIIEDEDRENETQFEKAWKELALSTVKESKFKHSTGGPIWEYLKRVDILSGIGHYGVLFIGLDDGLDLNKEAEQKEGQRILFLRAFDESCADIVEYETDVTNERFGLPKFYNIEFSSPEETGGIGVQSVTKKVHWSRVIHVADNIGANEVFGVPRMRPVYNRLWDLRKFYGGSAEMYWKGAFPGLSFETHPSLGANASIDTTTLREAIEDYQNTLKRYITLNGLSAKSLAPQVVDPASQIETQLDAICIQLGIPKRIFMGSERGELSSTQDQDAWNHRLETRQNTYVTPRIVVPLIDRLILLGVLPEPEEYQVVWPDLDAKTEEEKATIAIKQVHALTKYVAGDVEVIMSPIDFYTRIMGLEMEEAEGILENAIEAFEESEERDLKRDIIEAKALAKHKQPAIPDNIKQQLLEADETESVRGDALSDKFTDSAQGDKALRKITSTRVDALDEGDDEDEGLGGL